MKRYMGLLAVMLLAASGCRSSADSTPQAAAATTEVIATLGSDSGTDHAMTPYVDKQSGITFDYPTGWAMLEPPPNDAVIYSYMISSFSPSTNAGSENMLSDGQTKMDVTFFGKDETLDSAQRSLQADVDSGFAVIMKQETRTAADGSPVYYYAIQGRLGGAAQVVYTSVKGRVVSITAYGEGAHFEDVVKSLRSA
jgi:hypothetical protein